MLPHAPAVAILVRGAQIGDDVALTQILRQLGVLIERGGQRERLPGLRILQRLEWNPTARVQIRGRPGRERDCHASCKRQTRDDDMRNDPSKQ
jgi:hypothetical protein